MLSTELAALFNRDLLRLQQELQAFPDTASIWKTAPGVTNAAGSLALHLEGNLREFVGRQLGGIDYTRDRPLEFSARGVEQDELVARIDALRRLIPPVVEKLSAAALDAIYPEQVYGTPISTCQFLIHLNGHLNYHLGQIDYLRRMTTGNGAIALAALEPAQPPPPQQQNQEQPSLPKASPPASPPQRMYHVLGVPLRTGSLYPGNENDAAAYRDAQIVARLQAAAGCAVVDDGDVAIPSYLPHHTIAPIRSWPGPRIAWDCVSDRILPILEQPGHVPLLIGCDCSIVVGTTQALMRASVPPEDVYVIYVDGDFDDAAPRPEKCQSAAAVAVWLLTQRSPFWNGPPLDASSQVTVIGSTNPSALSRAPRSISLTDLRRLGPAAAARQALDAIPASASVILHFDIDVFRQQDMPAAYFPHADGLTLSEGAALLAPLLADPRLRIIEVTEYAALRDPDHTCAGQLVDLFSRGLQQEQR